MCYLIAMNNDKTDWRPEWWEIGTMQHADGPVVEHPAWYDDDIDKKADMLQAEVERRAMLIAAGALSRAAKELLRQASELMQRGDGHAASDG